MTASPGPVTRAELAEMNRRMTAIEADNAETKQLAQETHDMVQKMHAALMTKQPGQDATLLDRMAAQTIAMESGVRVARMLIFVAGFLAALGAIGALLKWQGGGQ